MQELTLFDLDLPPSAKEKIELFRDHTLQGGVLHLRGNIENHGLFFRQEASLSWKRKVLLDIQLRDSMRR